MSDSEPVPTNSERKGVALLLRRIAFLSAGFIFLIASAGLLYRAIEARSDARRFKQEGRSVDIGGYKLNISCTGSGSPEVILESGLGGLANDWHPVQSGIAKFTRVCSYDRAGYGWSDPGPMPRTHTQIARELHTLLVNSGERPPYVLVGHSFGGTDVRIYNGLYPGEVVGMVLAEAGQEDVKYPPSILALAKNDLKRRQSARRWAPLLYRSGISRFLARKDIDDPAASLADQEWAYLAIQPKFIAATTSEVEIQANNDAVRAAGTLGDKPLIVLTAGKGMFGLPLTTQDWVDLRNRWVDSHMLLAHLSTRGKRIIVPDTGHMIPDERPEAIVNAVQEILADLKNPNQAAARAPSK
jgi:pimeloyl-ACP methyl ester carboxylesterase